MLRNYLTTALRNLLRYKVYTAINILGLAIGMACCVLALLYIQHEFSFDSFHPNADRIYRIIQGNRDEGGDVKYDFGVTAGMAVALREDFPEVELVTRAWYRWGLFIRHGQEGHNQVLCLVDPEFLEMFDFPGGQGDAQALLRDPGSILITKKWPKPTSAPKTPSAKSLAWTIAISKETTPSPAS